VGWPSPRSPWWRRSSPAAELPRQRTVGFDVGDEARDHQHAGFGRLGRKMADTADMSLVRRRHRGPHVVEVNDVRPFPGERRPWEPYFVALCTCNFSPQVRETEADARSDAQDHASATGGTLPPGLRRTVG
jgi:hypothetical protein